MARTGFSQHRLERDRTRHRFVSWLAAVLVLVASSAFALRPTAGVLAAITAREHRETVVTCAYAAHAHHDHQGPSHADHGGHCLFCFAPALATGAASLVRTPERAYALAPRPAALEVVHAALEHHGHVQSRAPPAV